MSRRRRRSDRPRKPGPPLRCRLCGMVSNYVWIDNDWKRNIPGRAHEATGDIWLCASFCWGEVHWRSCKRQKCVQDVPVGDLL